jgi:hypothetical protein
MLSQRYSVRPSEFLRGDWLDYQFDLACALQGKNALNKNSDKPPTTQYSPLVGKARKIKLPETGVW